jgi:hypothetical protein
MMILLNPRETEEYLVAKAREKILEETSRFPQESTSLRDLIPTVQEMCDGTKAKPANWPSHRKTEIMALVALEKSKAELSEYREDMYLTPKPVLDYIEKAARKLAAEGSTKPIEAHQEHVGKTLDAEVGSMSDDNENVTDGFLDGPKPHSKRQDRIDEIILVMEKKGRKYSTIATEINQLLGGHFTSDHVAERLKELRPE